MSFDVHSRLNKLKHSAKGRGLNVNLDVNKYQVLIDQGCHYCGNDLSKENGYCLDRVDSTKGYNIQNVVGCCKICNRAKSDMDVFEFIEWITKAFKHMKKQLEYHASLQAKGVTQEIYDQLEEAYYREMNKDKQKERVKHVYSGKV